MTFYVVLSKTNASCNVSLIFIDIRVGRAWNKLYKHHLRLLLNMHADMIKMHTIIFIHCVNSVE